MWFVNQKRLYTAETDCYVITFRGEERIEDNGAKTVPRNPANRAHHAKTTVLCCFQQ